jgi:hypothetical protein
MSNRTYIEPTEFISVRSGKKDFGFRMYDDYTGTYKLFDSSIPDDDMDFLKLVLENLDDVSRDMIDFIRETQSHLYIGDTLYTYEEIKKVLEG